jgi:subtilase family serine protease
MPLCGGELQSRKGHVPPAVKVLKPISSVAGTKRIDLAIGLPLRDRGALTKLLEQLYDPASPLYRQFLTPEQFVQRFGPTEQDYQVVVNFAKSNHLALTGTHANRLLIDVNGSVADIERAFHTRLRVYHHPTEPTR